MSWEYLRMSRLSSEVLELQKHNFGGVIRTKDGCCLDEGSQKCFESYRSVVRTMVEFRQDKGRRPDDATLSSG